MLQGTMESFGWELDSLRRDFDRGHAVEFAAIQAATDTVDALSRLYLGY
jgi:hypothetical protein